MIDHLYLRIAKRVARWGFTPSRSRADGVKAGYSGIDTRSVRAVREEFRTVSKIQIRKCRGLVNAASLDLRTPSGRPMPY
jgi:hypothetical protein